MIFDKIVLLTIFLYITLNLRKVENFIQNGYKFEAFTAEEDAIKWRVFYTLLKSTTMLFVLHILIERHDSVGRPAPKDNNSNVLEADTWDGRIITSNELNVNDYHSDQKEGSWLYGVTEDDLFPTAPITPGNPFAEDQSWKDWFRDQLGPIVSLLCTGALWTTLAIAWNKNLNSSLWQGLLWMETITNEVVNVVIIYVILKFAQKDVSKGVEKMAEKIHDLIDPENNADKVEREALQARQGRALSKATLKKQAAEAAAAKAATEAAAAKAATEAAAAKAATEAAAAKAATEAAAAKAATEEFINPLVENAATDFDSLD
jgi:hypothetical protein